MRIYVAGCGGMLGEAAYRILGPTHTLKCTDIDVNATWLEHCDIRVFEEYERSVAAFRPDILMHFGALTDLEYCESNPDDAYLTNTLSVEHAAQMANSQGAVLVYISTAGIFDGSKARYDDWDHPNPIGVYGRSKYLGEIVTQRQAARYFICRAGWMMGGGPAKDKKFIAKIMRQLHEGRRTLDVVDDKIGSPTYTQDFIRNLWTLLATPHYGLYNMAGEGNTSRLEVARYLVALLGLEQHVTIRPVSSDFFSGDYFAPRPESEALRNYKLELRGMNQMQDWRPALKAYVLEYYGDYVRTFAPDFDLDVQQGHTTLG